MNLETKISALEDEVAELKHKQDFLETTLMQILATVNHTDASMGELLTLYKKSKIVFSFLRFLAKLAAPIGYFLGAVLAVFAFVTHNGSVFKLFK